MKSVLIDSEPPDPSEETASDASSHSPGGLNTDAPGECRVTCPSAPLDAWNEDQVRRGSYPPEGGDISRWRAESASIGRGDRWVPARKRRAAPGDAFDLVRRSAATHRAVDLATEMAERFAVDDFAGALRAAEFLLGRNPADSRAQHYARASRQKLEQRLHARVTQHGTVPVVEARDEEIRWLGLDARAMWLLSRIDGEVGCDALIDAMGMERLEGLRVLAQLLDAGAIVMRGPREG